MATYIPQVQDKIEKVRPPQTDWQMEYNLLSTRQGNYDKNHEKLKQLYGKILTAPLSREDNMTSRDDFFKLIESDLRKVAGMDLSKDSNVAKATNVFNQIYQNDYLVKDMVWTKEFQAQMQRAESFRNCVDPDKCGGEYWEEGVKYMRYKQEEFKAMSADESLGAQNVRYIPYNNMMDKAIKAAEEAGLNVTIDELDGRYIITNKNGEKVLGPMTMLFESLFANNPQLNDMYKVKAYNTRKDWAYNAVATGQYQTLNEANSAYIQQNAQRIIDANTVMANGVDLDVSSIKSKIKALESDIQSGKYDPETPAVKAQIENLNKMLNGALVAQEYTNILKSAQKRMNHVTDMNRLGDIIDNGLAAQLFGADLDQAAYVMAHRDMEKTMDADKFALADQKYRYDLALMNAEYDRKEKLEAFKAKQAKTGDMRALTYMSEYQKQRTSLDESSSLATLMGAELEKNHKDIYARVGSLWEGKSESEIRQYLDDYTGPDKDIFQNIFNTSLIKYQEAQYNLNKAAANAIHYGNPITNVDFEWNVFTKETLDAYKIAVGDDVWNTLTANNVIPIGLQGLYASENPDKYPVYEFPGSEALYYKKGNDWYIGKLGMDQTNYTKITDVTRAGRLDKRAFIYGSEDPNAKED